MALPFPPGRAPAPGGDGFAVVDVEATGRSPWRHRVVEVGVVLLDRELRAEAEFATLVDPAGPVGPTEVHGIAQVDVAGAPRFRGIAPFLLELLAGRVLVGHHVSCDRAFLEREFARIGVSLPPVPLVCTMRLARRHLPEAGGFGLGACVAAAGLDGAAPHGTSRSVPDRTSHAAPHTALHTALGDARAAADLLRYCVLARSAPSTDWAEPLRVAAGLPWPRLGGRRAAPVRRGDAPA